MELPKHPNLRARWLLMSAHLYYDRDCCVLTDAEFDKLSLLVASDIEDAEMFEGTASCLLEPILLHMLGEPDDIRATACHVLISQATFYGAEAWYESVAGEPPSEATFGRGTMSEAYGVLLTSVSG